MGPNPFVRSRAAEFLPVAANNVKNKKAFCMNHKTKAAFTLHVYPVFSIPGGTDRIRPTNV